MVPSHFKYQRYSSQSTAWMTHWTASGLAPRVSASFGPVSLFRSRRIGVVSGRNKEPNRTGRTEPNRTETLKSGTGRNRTRKRTELNRTEPRRVRKTQAEPRRTGNVNFPNRTEPNRTEPMIVRREVRNRNESCVSLYIWHVTEREGDTLKFVCVFYRTSMDYSRGQGPAQERPLRPSASFGARWEGSFEPAGAATGRARGETITGGDQPRLV